MIRDQRCKTRITIVGGCGHVGIPLGLTLAEAGYSVALLDINGKAVEQINQGKLPFLEEGAEECLTNIIGKTLRATTFEGVIKESDIVFFVTGTPVDEHSNPRVHDVLKIIDHYLPLLSPSKLIILRSTIYPGVLELVENRIQKALGSCRLAYCPERIVQGKGIDEIKKLPQLVSATSQEAEDAAAELFADIASKIIRLTPREAELAKLITNTWRYLEFAIANQFYMMLEGSGVSFYRVFAALSEDYPRARHFARPGFAAGPCLYKDTMQLAAYHKRNFFLGHSAMLVNEELPVFLADQLEKKMGNLEGKKIAILGMTFKADNDDIRESLSFKLKKVLEMKLAEVLPCDPYLADTVPLQTALETADGIILGVPHKQFKGLRIEKPFIDCWGIWDWK